MEIKAREKAIIANVEIIPTVGCLRFPKNLLLSTPSSPPEFPFDVGHFI
jgi:hypothetical protein